MTHHVITYRGKRLGDCTREELIACIEWMSTRLHQLHETIEMDREIEREIARTRAILRATRRNRRDYWP